MSDNFELRLQGMLNFIDINGTNGFDDSKVEELERLIGDCQDRMKSEYKNQVADAIYDTLWDMLKRVKPDSNLLSEIWEDEEGDNNDYTELLVKNPMMSIETAKSWDCDAINNFIARMPDEKTNYFASYKINGHGIRVVYKNGDLVSATSRARASAGRDITRHLKIVLGEHNEELEGYGQVELRGELCLPMENLDKAREFNPEIKSAFSAVASLVRPSSTEEEIKLLDFLCYGFLCDDVSFNSRDEEFTTIQDVGFSTPQYTLIEGINKSDLKEVMRDVVQQFGENYETFGYFCDGVVFECDDRQLFASLGTEGNHNCGNVALKVDTWKQDQYPGYVQRIIWTRGKSKLSPVAIVAEQPDMLKADSDGKIINKEELGVLTSQGNRVTRVPLYEPRNILVLDAYVGNIIYFRYGGEAGVVPCFPDGKLLTEDASKDILTGDYKFDKGESLDGFEEEQGVHFTVDLLDDDDPRTKWYKMHFGK